MLASLEVRSPFLDPGVIDFAFSLPDELRVTTRAQDPLRGSRANPSATVRQIAQAAFCSGRSLAEGLGLVLPLHSALGQCHAVRSPNGDAFTRYARAGRRARQSIVQSHIHRVVAARVLDQYVTIK
jgi:hypothetical protein